MTQAATQEKISTTPFLNEGTQSATVYQPYRQHLGFGKYHEIVLAVAFFLIFDLAVLVLNFYISFQISEDAVSINLSGRQRMLTQRTAKSLFALENAQREYKPYEKELEELILSVRLFDTTLRGFQQGAIVNGGDGKPVELRAAKSVAARQALDAAQIIWIPYLEMLKPVLDNRASAVDLADVVTYARTNNVKLLGLMNELTTILEREANERATQLRWVQTGGIVLALLNFMFILFKFIRRLRKSDAAIESVNQENREILTSVREGLFLITPELKLGTQISAASTRIFGQELRPGDSLIEVLRPMIPPKVLHDAGEYLKLLFSPHVKEQLVQSLNPLKMLQIAVKDRLGQAQIRHISLEFNRARMGGYISHLLVTAQDISRLIELESALTKERSQTRRYQNQIMATLLSEPVEVARFVQRAKDSLLIINDILKSIGDGHNKTHLRRQISEVMRRVHSIKGEAALLNLSSLVDTAHEFENLLENFSGNEIVSGENLLTLPIPLEKMLVELQAIENICSQYKRTLSSDCSVPALESQLRQFVSDQARVQGKQVNLVCEFDSALPLDKYAPVLREIVSQFIRNAIAHGIETPDYRKGIGKNPIGKLVLTVKIAPDGRIQISLRDDGAGIDPAKIRTLLLKNGIYSTEQLQELDDRQILTHIFRSGFSTAATTDIHSGRGIGLDVVYARILELGGSIGLGTQPGFYTEFRVSFPV